MIDDILTDIVSIPGNLLKAYYKNGKLNVNRVAIDLIPFLCIFYMIDKYLQACTASGQTDWLDACVQGFSLMFKTSPVIFPSLQPVPLFCGLAAGILFKLYMNGRKKNAKNFRRGEEYGSSRWSA